MIKIVISNQTNPYWNVAVENYLVGLPDEGCVYMYLWKNRRTVVVGMNQNPFAECNVTQLQADGGFVMRRTTGGGAVYHDDGNLNFSFVAPYSLYDQLKQFEVIRCSLHGYGLDAELSGRNDLLCQGRKFSGNAFSKGRQQRLHHGTILIKGNMEDLSRYLKVRQSKLQKHGVASVQSRVVNLSELADVTSENIVPHLINAFEEVYGQKAETLEFADLMKNPEVIALYEKYSSDEWIFGRWRHFSAQFSQQFAWGHVEISLNIDQEQSKISNVCVATDAIDVGLAGAIETLLTGASSTEPPQIGEEVEYREMLADVLTMIY